VDRDRQTRAFEATIDSFLAFYAPDVVCYPAPGWVQEKVCRGHDGLRRLSAVWSANFTDVALEIHDVRDLRERLVVLAELNGRDRSSGMPSSQRFGAVNSRLGDDGKVGEVRFFLSWSEALETVGLSG
jgi:hypothetical protein